MIKNINKRFQIMFYISVAMIAVSYFFVLFFFKYIDTFSLTAWCVTFWDSLFSGNLGTYFTYADNYYRGATHVASCVPWITFFPWIIWNLPIYLTHPLSKNPDIGGMKCIGWSKLFLVVCLVILCVYIYKILKHITNNDLEFSLAGMIIVAASLEMLTSVAYAGQDEIIYLTALVITLHQYIMGKKKSGLAFAILTVTLNPMMIIPIFALFFVTEKRIWLLAVNAFLCLLPGRIFEFAYRGDLAYQEGKTANTLMIFQLMMNTGTIDTTIGPTPIAIVILIALMFVAYFNKDSEENRAGTMIYYFSIAFFALTFLSYSIWYRNCLYVPFFVLMVGMSKENREIKVFLLELLLLFRFVACLADFSFSYGFVSSIGMRIVGEVSGQVIDPHAPGFDNLFYITRPVTLAAAILLLVICNKRFDKKLEFKVPWKVVSFVAPLSCVAFCVFVILNAH